MSILNLLIPIGSLFRPAIPALDISSIYLYICLVHYNNSTNRRIVNEPWYSFSVSCWYREIKWENVRFPPCLAYTWYLSLREIAFGRISHRLPAWIKYFRNHCWETRASSITRWIFWLAWALLSFCAQRINRCGKLRMLTTYLLGRCQWMGDRQYRLSSK